MTAAGQRQQELRPPARAAQGSFALLDRAQQRRARIAGMIGNVVEWYDFALYGYLAGIISSRFFPADDETASLIAGYGVFAAGFVMRPLGAAVFGWLGDTIGRGRTMLISVALMAVPTVLLGLLPDWHAIGTAAPVLLVAIRLLQGLSVGGEFSSSVTYLVETAPDDARGRAGSLANVGSMAGMLLGAAAASAVTTFLPEPALSLWGWRLPFLAGGLIGTAGLMLRRGLPRSPHFRVHQAETPSRSPFARLWRNNRRELAQAFVLAGSWGMIFYLVMVYLPNWLERFTATGQARALQIDTLATLIVLPLMWLTAWVGDRWIRRTRWVALALGAMGLAAVPLWGWMLGDGLAAALTTQLFLAALAAVPLGSVPAIFVELFPSEDRMSGYSLAFNLGVGIFGGSTPMAATWLIDRTGTPMAAGWMLAAACAVAVGALLWIRDGSREPLR